ncbi:GNAT family N-acetyltransferase [Streptomyces sp. DSM 44915]|uniref:GNAT family N-acetyltransferase n=1 Tax=Streptomyces chisholmiae TaxID=3075540 RepID=A0ABU2JPC4_9ACTN|nr:GNAT family N-acetyltransferase [Streptomyces sp. DSM 44915]MDT0266359.1 GNAT family N-acetyltransferase [Streptomyces sp. DSM 44915]
MDAEVDRTDRPSWADQRTLAGVLGAVARGVFPPADAGITVVPQPNDRDAGVLGMTAHAVVFTDQDPDWVRAAVRAASPDPLAAPLGPAFLTALGARTGRRVNCVDLLTVAPALPGPPDLPLREITEADHPRVVRARRFRDGVRVWAAAGGLVVLGRGVAGRWEVAIEVDEAARGHGLGRALAVAGRHLVPAGELLWSQQPPGNARSVRTFQAAGYRPVGAEALLVTD